MPSHRSSKTRLLQILFASGGYAQLRFEDGTLSPGNPLAYSDPLRCMEPGEPGYGDCLVALIGQEAIREFQEETGISVRNPSLFATYDLKGENDAPDKRTHFFLSVFLVEADTDTVALAADDASEAGWYSPDEILTLPAPASVYECATRLKERLEGAL